MLRKPGHKIEKVLFLLGLVLVFSSLALALLHFVEAFMLIFSLGLYLLIALFTYSNLSMRTRTRNVEKAVDIVGISPDQAYDALLSFFSEKHGYHKMQVLHSSKPELIAVKLNSWIGMGRSFHRPPGSVSLHISASEGGSEVQLEFDFSGFSNVIYGIAGIFVLLFFGQVFGVIRVTSFFLLYSVSLGMTLCGLIVLLQIPFTSTLEARAYLRRKVRERLTRARGSFSIS